MKPNLLGSMMTETSPKNQTEDKEKSTVLIDVTSKNTDSFPCHICGKYFSHHSSLYRHKKSAHPQAQSGSIFCQETNCSFCCRTLQDLRRHLKCTHNMCMEEECKNFDSMEGNEHVDTISMYITKYSYKYSYPHYTYIIYLHR